MCATRKQATDCRGQHVRTLHTVAVLATPCVCCERHVCVCVDQCLECCLVRVLCDKQPGV
jgi:hypothetical protein